VCRLKAQAAARNAAKKKAEEDKAAIAKLVPESSVNTLPGVVKGSDPSRDCQSYPAVLRDVTKVKEGEEFDFLKKDFDVPQRVAAHSECTGVDVDQIKIKYTGIDNEQGELDDTRHPKKENNVTKKELDILLDKDASLLESGSFFDKFELGDVVSSLYCVLSS
jgi:hypothetical protein